MEEVTKSQKQSGRRRLNLNRKRALELVAQATNTCGHFVLGSEGAMDFRRQAVGILELTERG